MKLYEVEEQTPEQIILGLKERDPISIQFATNYGVPAVVQTNFQELGDKIDILKRSDLDSKQIGDLHKLTINFEAVKKELLDFIIDKMKPTKAFSRRALFHGAAKGFVFAARLPTLLQTADKLVQTSHENLDVDEKLAVALARLKKNWNPISKNENLIKTVARKVGLNSDSLNQFIDDPVNGFDRWVEVSYTDALFGKLTPNFEIKWYDNNLIYKKIERMEPERFSFWKEEELIDQIEYYTENGRIIFHAEPNKVDQNGSLVLEVNIDFNVTDKSLANRIRHTQDSYVAYPGSENEAVIDSVETTMTAKEFLDFMIDKEFSMEKTLKRFGLL